MVVRRTVHHLRQRPRHEREAVAAWIAIGIMAILLLAWMFFFFRGIKLSSPQLPQTAPTATQTTQSQNAAAAQPQIIQVSSTTDDTYNASDTQDDSYDDSNSYNANTVAPNPQQTQY